MSPKTYVSKQEAGRLMRLAVAEAMTDRAFGGEGFMTQETAERLVMAIAETAVHICVDLDREEGLKDGA